MSIGATQTFRLPDGWTLRQVATAMVRTWLPPLQAEPLVKKARWVVQSVMEDVSNEGAPIWEPGISTAEYEERLDREGLSWKIRATFGRVRSNKGAILARFSMGKHQRATFQLESAPDALPESLLNSEKVEQFLDEHGVGREQLFAALLMSNGCRPVSTTDA